MRGLAMKAFLVATPIIAALSTSAIAQELKPCSAWRDYCLQNYVRQGNEAADRADCLATYQHAKATGNWEHGGAVQGHCDKKR